MRTKQKTTVGLIAAGIWLMPMVVKGQCPESLGYSYERTLTLGTATGTDLQNFPIVISIPASDFNGHLQTNKGYDVIFTDNSYNQLDEQIEDTITGRTSGTLVVWVKIPTLSSATNTTIKMLYGKIGATDPSVTSVWTAGYKGVWHFGNNSDTVDASGNGNTASNYGTATTSGQIGGARSFNINKSTDSITVPKSPSLEPDSYLTVSAWIKRAIGSSGTSNWSKILWYGKNSPPDYGPYGLQFGFDNDFINDSVGIQIGDANLPQGAYSLNDNDITTWHYIVGTYNKNTQLLKFYFDGDSASSALWDSIHYDNGTSYGLILGNRHEDQSQYYSGLIDEVRISDTVRSSGWIKTEYANQSNPIPGGFYSLGGEEWDNIPPTALCQNYSAYLNGSGDAVVNASDIDNGSTDNCTPQSNLTLSLDVGNPITYQCSDIGTHSVQLTVTDMAGNGSTCTATVAVADTTRPSLTTKPVTVYLDASGNASIVPTDVFSNGSDNCGTVNLVSVTPNAFNCSNLGNNIVTLTVNDGHGNTNTDTATVAVADTTRPSLTTKPVTVYLDASGNASIVPTDVFSNGSDNCGTVNLVSVTPNAFNCSNLGNNIVTLTVNDGHGNTNTDTATVAVADTTRPSLTTKPVTVYLDASGNASIVPTDVFSNGSDNCGTVNLVSVTPNAFNCSNLGNNIVTLTVNDGHGNTNTDTATVAVADTTRPSLTTKPVTVYLDASGNASIVPTDVFSNGSDNCGTVNLVSVTPNAFNCSNLGNNIVTLTVNDGHGNTNTDTATVAVADTTRPSLTTKPVTVYLDASGNASIVPTDVFSNGSDNCGTVNLVSVTPNAFNCSNLGNNIVTLTVNDGHGNTNTDTATVAVADTTRPSLTTKPVTVYLDASGNASIVPTDVFSNGSDNCGTVNLVSVTPNAFNCSNLGNNIVTLTVNDGHGNTNTDTATVAVADTTRPSLTTKPVTVYLDASGNASIVPTDVFSNGSDNCGTVNLVSVTPNAFNCSNLGNNIVTLTVNDGHGNTNTDTATVAVADTTRPSLTTKPVTVYLDASGNASIVPTDVFSNGSDNCGTVNLVSVTPNAFNCSNLGNNIVTLTVNDGHGNTNTDTATVAVADTTRPSLTTKPVTVYLDASGNASIVPTDVFSNGSDNCGTVNLVSVTPNAFNCSNLGNNIVTLTVNDGHGNTNTDTATVAVADTIKPTFTQPSDITICRASDCSYDANPLVTGSVSDENDNCSTGIHATYTDDLTNLPSCENAGFIKRTWSLSDFAGNVTTKIQIIWVEPVIQITASNDTLCNGSYTDIDPTSSNTATKGIRYTWSVTDNSGGIIAGYSNSTGNGKPLGRIISQPLSNSDSIAHYVTYIITPYSIQSDSSLQCAGINDTVNIWVEPTAKVTVTPKKDTICNNTNVSIRLNSPSTPTRPVKLRYAVVSPSGVTVTPASGTALDNGSVLTNSILNTNNSAQLVEFIVIPYTRQAGSEVEKCTGINDTAFIWVEPTAKVTVTPKKDTICNNTNVSIRLNSPSTPTRPVKLRYAVVSPSGVTVTPASGTALDNGSVLTNSILNTNNSAQLVEFIVTPYTRQAGSEVEKCTGINDTAFIWVEPTAKVTVTPKKDTICNNTNVSIRLNSPSTPTRPVKLRYAVVSPSGVTVTPAFGTALDNGSVLTNSILNTNNSAQLVEFIVTPYTRQAGSEAEKCTGINDTAFIWVEPTAKVTVTPKKDTICNNTNVSIRLNSPSTPTRPVKLRYAVVSPSGVTVTPASGTALDNGSVLTNSILNTNNSAQLVEFIVTPYTRQAGSEAEKCTGINDTAFIWVEPTAKVTVTPKKDTICNNTNVSIRLNSPSTPTRPVKLRYAVVSPSGVTVTPASGTALNNGSVLTNSILNTNNSAQLVEFIVTPYTRQAGSEAEKCTGINDTAFIWVEPTITITASGDTLCNNMFTGIKPNSNIITTHGIKFTWTVLNPSGKISGFANNNTGVLLGSTISQQLTNSDTLVHYVTYQLIPYSTYRNGSLHCSGSPLNLTIYVNPTPRIRVGLSKGLSNSLDSICYDQGTKLLISTPNTKVIGKVKYDLQVTSTGSVTGIAVNGRYGIANLSQNLTNTSNQVQTVTYIFTPLIDSVKNDTPCGNGVKDTVKVTIVPDIHFGFTAKTYIGGKNIRCYGESNGSVKVIDASGGLQQKGYTYQWNTGARIDSVYNIKAGTYTVTVTDHLGCYKTQDTTLTQPDTLKVDSVQVTPFHCTGQTKGGIILSSVSGGTGPPTYPYSYSWTGPSSFTSNQDTLQNLIYPGIYYLTLTDVNGCVFAKPYTVLDMTIKWNPNARFYGPTSDSMNIACYGLSDGSFNPVFSPNPAKTYAWTGPNGFTSSVGAISGLQVGQYTLQVVDTKGCSNTFSYTLKQPDSIRFQSSVSLYPPGYNVQCAGGNSGVISITNVTGGHKVYQYQWNTEDGNGLLSGTNHPVQDSLSAGTFRMTIFDGYCSVSDSFTLTQPPKLVVNDTIPETNGYAIACNGSNTGNIALSSSGGYGTYGYNWTATGGGTGIVQGDSVQSNLSAGTYSVVVTYGEGVCPVGPFRYTLLQPPPLTINPDSLFYTPSVKCYKGSDGYIIVSGAGGYSPNQQYIYSWDTTDGSPLNPSDQKGINNLRSGDYTVTITDKNNCQLSKTFTIKQPDSLTVNLIETDVSCKPGSNDGSIVAVTAGGTRPYSYYWLQNGNDMTTAKDSAIYGIPAGLYTVIVNDTNKCGPVISPATRVAPRKSLNIKSVISDYHGVNISCYGRSDGSVSTTIVGGMEPYYYHWYSINDTLQVLDTLANFSSVPANTYLIKVNDRNGCNGDTIIKLTQPDSLEMVFSKVDLLCAGEANGSITVSVAGGTKPYTYTWSNQTSAPENDKLTAGWYTLTLTDANTCEEQDSVEITQPTPMTVTLDDAITHYPFCPDALDGAIGLDVDGGVRPYSYDWLNVEGNPTTSDLTNIRSGIYLCNITDANSCLLKDTVRLNPKVSLCLDIPNVFSPNGDGINDTWVILAGDPKDPVPVSTMYPNAIIEIYTRWGTLVFRSEPGYPNPWNGIYRGIPLPIDSYFYVIDPKNGESTICGNVTIVK